MSGLAPESLLQEWLPEHRSLVERVIFAEPFHVPYDRLATVDGWTLWLGHPPIPDGLPLMPAPEELIWDDPGTAVVTALLVAADYAIRRGAVDSMSAAVILHRESPIAIVIPGPLNQALEPILIAAETAGVPVVRGEAESPDELAAMIDSFGMRRAAHAVDLGRRHDPALSFQTHVPGFTTGGTPLSSLLVHNEPAGEGVKVEQEIGLHLGIAIGVSGPAVTLEKTLELERLAAEIPSFLDRISASVIGDSLSIGWGLDNAPTPEELANAFRVWLSALTGVEVTDVRIEFGVARRSDEELSKMRARANEYRNRREEAIARTAERIRIESLTAQQSAE
jgi:hypothetical protein